MSEFIVQERFHNTEIARDSVQITATGSNSGFRCRNIELFISTIFNGDRDKKNCGIQQAYAMQVFFRSLSQNGF
jgi:hypothetical protein